MYANLDDLQSRWRDLSVQEKTRAAVLLKDAEVMILAELTSYGKKLEDVEPAILRLVECNMCARVLSAGTNAADITQMTESAGCYSQTYTYSQPGTSLYISKKERRLLGIGGARIGGVSLC